MNHKNMFRENPTFEQLHSQVLTWTVKGVFFFSPVFCICEARPVKWAEILRSSANTRIRLSDNAFRSSCRVDGGFVSAMNRSGTAKRVAKLVTWEWDSVRYKTMFTSILCSCVHPNYVNLQLEAAERHPAPMFSSPVCDFQGTWKSRGALTQQVKDKRLSAPVSRRWGNVPFPLIRAVRRRVRAAPPWSAARQPGWEGPWRPVSSAGPCCLWGWPPGPGRWWWGKSREPRTRK